MQGACQNHVASFQKSLKPPGRIFRKYSSLQGSQGHADDMAWVGRQSFHINVSLASL